MNKKKLLLITTLIIVVLIQVRSGEAQSLSCVTRTGSCQTGEVCLFSYYKTTNSHIAQCGYYDNQLCCKSNWSNRTLKNATWTTNPCQTNLNQGGVLSTYKANNTHATSYGTGVNNLCVSCGVSCAIKTSCDSDETQIMSFYNNENAHTSDQISYYGNQLCCKMSDPDLNITDQTRPAGNGANCACNGYVWDANFQGDYNDCCEPGDSNSGMAAGGEELCRYCNNGDYGTQNITETYSCNYYGSQDLNNVFEDNKNNWCFDTDNDYCYAWNNSDVCSSTGIIPPPINETCRTPGTVEGTTCYYDNNTPSDRSDDCGVTGCSVKSCELGFGELCDARLGCVVNSQACLNKCSEKGFTTGYVKNNACYCVPGEKINNTQNSVTPLVGEPWLTYTYSFFTNSSNDYNLTTKLWINNTITSEQFSEDEKTVNYSINGLSCSRNNYYYATAMLNHTNTTYQTSEGYYVERLNETVLNNWWNNSWKYRIPLKIIANNTMNNDVALVRINLTVFNVAVNKNSTRVINSNGEELPHDCNWVGDSCDLLINWTGTHLAGENETLYLYLDDSNKLNTETTLTKTVDTIIIPGALQTLVHGVGPIIDDVQTFNTSIASNKTGFTITVNNFNFCSGYNADLNITCYVGGVSKNVSGGQGAQLYFNAGDNLNCGGDLNTVYCSARDTQYEQINLSNVWVEAEQNNVTTFTNELTSNAYSNGKALNLTDSNAQDGAQVVRFTVPETNYYTLWIRTNGGVSYFVNFSSVSYYSITAPGTVNDLVWVSVGNFTLLSGTQSLYFVKNSASPSVAIDAILLTTDYGYNPENDNVTVFGHPSTVTRFDPDDGQGYCSACGNVWDANFTSAARCCGDDGNNDNDAVVFNSTPKDLCIACAGGTYLNQECLNDVDNCAANGVIRRTSNASESCTNGPDCACYWGESCTSSGYTPPSNQSIPTCDEGGFSDGVGANCEVNNGNAPDYCYYGSGNVCSSNGLNLTNTTTVSGITCYNCAASGDAGWAYSDADNKCVSSVGCVTGIGWNGTVNTCYGDNDVVVTGSGPYTVKCYYIQPGKTLPCDGGGCNTVYEEAVCDYVVNLTTSDATLNPGGCLKLNDPNNNGQDTCYYHSTNVCDSDSQGFVWSNVTCPAPTQSCGLDVNGVRCSDSIVNNSAYTCVYDTQGVVDRSDDCTDKGCQTRSVTVGFGEVCDNSVGVSCGDLECNADCQSIGFSGGSCVQNSCNCGPSNFTFYYYPSNAVSGANVTFNITENNTYYDRLDFENNTLNLTILNETRSEPLLPTFDYCLVNGGLASVLCEQRTPQCRNDTLQYYVNLSDTVDFGASGLTQSVGVGTLRLFKGSSCDCVEDVECVQYPDNGGCDNDGYGASYTNDSLQCYTCYTNNHTASNDGKCEADANCGANPYCDEISVGEANTEDDYCCNNCLTPINCDSGDELSGGDGVINESEATNVACAQNSCTYQTLTCNPVNQCKFAQELISFADETFGFRCYYDSNTQSWTWNDTNNSVIPEEDSPTACNDGYDNDCDGLIDKQDNSCDNQPPKWFNLSVNDSTPKPGSVVEFSVFWTDDKGGLDEYVFEWNASGGFVNDSATIFSTNNNSWSNITKTVPNLEGQIISWRVWANDTYSNYNVTIMSNITVRDVTKPLITIHNPINQTVYYSSTVLLNFTPVDNVATSTTCWYTLDGATTLVGVVSNNSFNETTLTGLSDGVHLVNVTCQDDYNNNGTSPTINFTVDTQPPTVTLIKPVNNSNHSTNVDLEFVVVDNNAQTLTCYKNLDGVITLIGVVNNNTNNSTIMSGLSNGYHFVNVTCDDGGINGTSETHSFAFDNTPPLYYNLSSDSSTVNVSDYVKFSAFWTDNLIGLSGYSFEWNGTNCVNVEKLNDSFAALNDSWSNVTVQVGNLCEGKVIGWRFTGWDYLNNANTTPFNYLTVQNVTPTVTLISPNNNSWDVDGVVNFTFVALDNADNALSCELWLDNVVNNSIIANNNTERGVVVSGLLEGDHSWMVSCVDNAHNQGNSSEWVVRVDLNDPIITLLQPVNNYNSTINSVNFSFKYEDDVSEQASCSLYLNNVLNQTNSTTLNNTVTFFNVTGLSDGVYEWNITCVEDSGRWSSQSRSLTVDSTPPQYYNAQVNDSNVFPGDVVEFSVLWTDNLAGLDSYKFEWNASGSCDTFQNVTTNNFASNNNSWSNVTLTIPMNCEYVNVTWRVWANDSFNNWNVSENVLTVQGFAPNVTLHEPVHTANLSTTLITFNFSATDLTSQTMSCALLLDGVVNETNSSVLNDTFTLFQVSGVSEGNHYWNVNCTDKDGQSKVAPTNYDFTIDLTPPFQKLNQPINYYNSTNTTLVFNYTPLDNLAPVLDCSLIIDGVYEFTNNGAPNNTNVLNTRVGLVEGGHEWWVECKDPRYNPGEPPYSSNTTKWRFTIDTNPPIIVVSNPVQGEIINSSSVVLNFTPVDNVVNTLTCWYTLDSVTTLVGSVTNNSQETVLLTVSDGNHLVNVTCQDGWAEHNATSQTINFTVDTNKPIITLHAPLNNTCVNSTVVFNYSFFDGLSSVGACDLIINSQVNNTTTVVNNSFETITVSGFQVSTTYNYWNVTCSDQANNQNTSDTWLFKVSKPIGALCSADNECVRSVEMCGSIINACEGSYSNLARCCAVPPTSDGYYGGGNNSGPDDPVVEWRDYYCNNVGNVSFEVINTSDPDVYDYWEGGGNVIGLNDDPSAVFVDYYYLPNELVNATDNSTTLDCDNNGEDGFKYCNADGVTREERDYFVNVSSDKRSVVCSYVVTNVETCGSGVTDNDGDNPNTTSTCVVESGCDSLTGGCASTTYSDSCVDSNVLTEYVKSGNSCVSKSYDCNLFDTFTCVNTTHRAFQDFSCGSGKCGSVFVNEDLCSDNDYAISDNEIMDFNGCSNSDCVGTVKSLGSSCADPRVTPTDCVGNSCSIVDQTKVDVDGNGVVDMCCNGDWKGVDISGVEKLTAWPKLYSLTTDYDLVEPSCSYNQTMASSKQLLLVNANRNLTFKVEGVSNVTLVNAWLNLTTVNDSYFIPLSYNKSLTSDSVELMFTTVFNENSTLGTYNATVIVQDNNVNYTYYLTDYLQLDKADVSVLRVDSPKIAEPGDVINISIVFKNSGTINLERFANVTIKELTTNTVSKTNLLSDVAPGSKGVINLSFLLTDSLDVVSFYPQLLFEFVNNSYGGLVTINASPAYPKFSISIPKSVNLVNTTMVNITALNLNNEEVVTTDSKVNVYQVVDDDVFFAFTNFLGDLTPGTVWSFNPYNEGLSCGAYVVEVEGALNGVIGSSAVSTVITGCVS